MSVQAFFDPATATVSYLLADPASQRAAIIDPVLDYDSASARLSTTSADRLRDAVREQGLTLDWILETHAHADHLSAAAYLQQQLGGRIGIGAHIRSVQATFSQLFNLEPSFRPDGSQFDHLFEDGEQFQIGSLTATALWLPGHTPADMAYQIGSEVFVGDTLFMPDVGTARADFPGGDAATLYRSIQRLLALPPASLLYHCHDYPPAQRAPAWQSTVAQQRTHNIHVRDGISEAEFVALRRARDATLALPALLIPSIQINVRAGQLPAPEANGRRFLKIPLDLLG